MAIAFVQKASASSTGTGSNTQVSCAYGVNVTANNLLVAIAFVGDPSTSIAPSTVTDTLGNSWSSATSAAAGGTSNSACQIFYAVAGSSGSNSVTLNVTGTSGSSSYVIHIFEFSGTATSSPQDGSGGTATTVSTSPSATLTVTSTGSLIVAGAQNSLANPTIGSGYTTGPTAKNGWSAETSEYNVNVSSGSQAADFTTSGGGTGLVAAAFKPAASASSGGRKLMLLGVS